MPRWENLPVARLRTSKSSGGAVPSDHEVLVGLRAGDEDLFDEVVELWGSAMLRLALARVKSRAVAEEVVQEAWLTVLRNLDRFEERSAVRTWVLGIVCNLARARARTERRAVPLPPGDAGPVLEAARFRPAEATAWPDHWQLAPIPWPQPEEALLAGETRRVILDAVGALPPAQREVLVLRDLEGFSAHETCDALGLSETNQRVLLHRARSRVRQEIEGYFDATEPT
jgi:RNA polymerase sigma-70 factor (ECF subfamily)